MLDGVTLLVYFIYEVEEWVGVSPSVAFTSENLDKAVLDILRRELENKVDEEMGFIIAVIEASVVGDGLILPLSGDPDIYFPVRYKVLTFRPLEHEVAKGIVTRAERSGLYVRLGPRLVEGLVHRSQVMDENVVETPDGQGFQGVNTNRIVRVGDVVRVRITSIARTGTRPAYVLKIGLTMRQPYLGKEEWLKAAAKAET